MNDTTWNLDVIEVASPCTAPWDAMQGDERVRFCGQCELNVYNLSEMTRDEAEELVRNQEGRLCTRFYRRADGTVITRDCPVGLRAVRRRLVRTAAAVGALLLLLTVGAVSAVAGKGKLRRHQEGPLETVKTWIEPERHVVMGVCAPPAPPAPPGPTNGTPPEPASPESADESRP